MDKNPAAAGFFIGNLTAKLWSYENTLIAENDR